MSFQWIEGQDDDIRPIYVYISHDIDVIMATMAS